MIRIYEDNGNGGPWLHYEGSELAVSVEGCPPGAGLCDLRLYGVTWHPEDAPDDCLPASECERMRHIATYNPATDRIRWHAVAGSAALKYLSCPGCEFLYTGADCGCE